MTGGFAPSEAEGRGLKTAPTANYRGASAEDELFNGHGLAYRYAQFLRENPDGLPVPTPVVHLTGPEFDR